MFWPFYAAVIAVLLLTPVSFWAVLEMRARAERRVLMRLLSTVTEPEPSTLRSAYDRVQAIRSAGGPNSTVWSTPTLRDIKSAPRSLHVPELGHRAPTAPYVAGAGRYSGGQVLTARLAAL